MRILASLIVLFAFALPTLLTAEGEKTQPGGAKKEGGEKKVKLVCKQSKVSDVEFEVCVPEKNSPGTEIICTATVRNKSQQSFSYVYGSLYRNLIIEIKDSKGGTAPLTRFGKIVYDATDLRMLSKDIGPGESMRFTCNLALFFDLTIPGDYTMKVTTREAQFLGSPFSVDDVPFSVTNN